MNQKDPKAKEGMRIVMVSMTDDPNPIEPGTEGTIRLVDGMGIIHVDWDNDRTLGVIPGVDKYRLLEADSGKAAIHTAIIKTPSNVNKSMPSLPKTSSSITSSLKSSGIKTNQVTNNIKSAGIKDVKVESNKIKGGKADKMTVKDIAKKHKVSVDDIKKEIKIGVKVEKEHVGKDTTKAKEIAMDHISEFPDYYSNKKYGTLASEKGLEKSQRKKKVKTEITAAAGGASTGAYVGPAFGKGPLTKTKGVAKPGPLKESTMMKSIQDITTTANEAWSDLNRDGWKWNDKPIWKGGEIVDLLAKIKGTWDDTNLDISKEWDETQNLRKEDFMRIVKNRLNESKKNKKEDKEEIEETTTFSSVFGSGFPVTPIFAAKQGQWKAAKKPLWKGGKIVQKINSDDVLVKEANDVKFVKGGKYVKVKKKCTKFPYCSQGAIDNPLSISDSIKGSGTYVEEQLMKNIHEVAKETGKTFDEVYRIVKSNLKK